MSGSQSKRLISITDFFLPSKITEEETAPTKRPKKEEDVVELDDDDTEEDEDAQNTEAFSRHPPDSSCISSQCSVSIFSEIPAGDKSHVILPFYSFVEIKKGTEKMKKWHQIMRCYAKPVQSLESLIDAIMSYSKLTPHHFRGLRRLIDVILSSEERTKFFSVTLPFIVQSAKKLQRVFHQPIKILEPGVEGEVHLDHEQVAVLLANGFLCTFPPAQAAHLPGFDFVGLYKAPYPNCLEKLRCLVHYFERMAEDRAFMSKRYITFIRKVLGNPISWSTSEEALCSVTIMTEGTIEDDGKDCVQVDFANKYIGGGVLSHGCVQEEIRFVINPEFLVSRLFTPVMGDLESVHILGAERFSDYSGYGRTFEFKSNHTDRTLKIGDRIGTYLVAIDASENVREQFTPSGIARELNKAYCGYQRVTLENTPSAPHADFPSFDNVATGNWGCGVFGGDVHLKFLIQWMACSKAHRNMIYFTFGDEKLKDKLLGIMDTIRRNFTIGTLFFTITTYLESAGTSSVSGLGLYDYIRKIVGEDDEDNEEPADIPTLEPGCGWDSD